MTDPNRAGSESRTVDALLTDFFRAERPNVWPPAPPDHFAAASPVTVAGATVPSTLAGKRGLGDWLTRGRTTLTASAALLLAAVLAVTPDAAPRPTAPPTASGRSLLDGSSAEVPAAKVLRTPKLPESAPHAGSQR